MKVTSPQQINLRLNQALRQAAVNLTGDVANRMEFVGRNINTNLDRKDGLADLNDRYTKQAHNYMMTRYYDTKKGYSPYRTRDRGPYYRYANGKMERALKHVFQSDGHLGFTIYPNIKMMDEIAPQWYRLNYGAGAAGASGGSRARKPIKIGGSRTNIMLYPSYGPSPAFWMPPGVWSKRAYASRHDNITRGIRSGKTWVQDSVVGHYFYPTAGTINKPTTRGTITKGIKPRYFVEAGIDYLQRYYGRGLMFLFNRWVREGVRVS